MPSSVPWVWRFSWWATACSVRCSVFARPRGIPDVVIRVVMAMCYVGFLLGSLTIPRRLVTVGHIRVFAGLASLAAATALSYALLPAPLTWGVLR